MANENRKNDCLRAVCGIKSIHLGVWHGERRVPLRSELPTPSNDGRRLQGGEVTFDHGHGVCQKELETLKAQQKELKEEVAELRHMMSALTK